tara:strand:- start:1403 stop:2302 length:900 start_codon:yes stop_codon:yes gene_type:complete
MNDTTALQRLNENCLLVKITTGLPGQTYTSKTASQDACMANNANKDRVKSQVLKFTNKDIKPCRKVRDEAKAMLNSLSHPWDSHGKRLIQVSTYQNIKQRLHDARAEFYDERDKFVGRYSETRQRAANDLQTLFDPDKFPSTQEVGDQFVFDIETEAITDVNNIIIKGSVELTEEVKLETERKYARKLNDSVKEIAGRIVDQIKTSMASIKNFHEKQIKGENTKFFATALTGITTLCDALPSLNITDDADIKNFEKQIRDSLYQLDADQVKESAAVREEVMEAGDSLLSALENYNPTEV